MATNSEILAAEHPYDRIRKERCEWCSKRLTIYSDDVTGRVFHRTSIVSTADCHAPTEREYIAELAAQVAELEAELTRLREWHKVKDIEDEEDIEYAMAINRIQDENVTLRAERDQLRADAEAFRLLKESAAHRQLAEAAVSRLRAMKETEEAIKTIDAARQQTGGEE